ncbi:MAG: hypothetical protein ACPGJS_08670 [Flammeovirgaceae bacterium]
MYQNIFPNNIIKYIYKELTEGERAELVPELFQNNQLNEELNELLTLKEQLDQVELTPSEKCVDNILNYSKTFELEQSL